MNISEFGAVYVAGYPLERASDCATNFLFTHKTMMNRYFYRYTQNPEKKMVHVNDIKWEVTTIILKLLVNL